MTYEGLDPGLREGLDLVAAANERDIPLRLVGGFAIRVLTPSFPPRTRERQDLDLASVSSARVALTDLFVDRGYEPDRHFNALYGHKQLFFASPNDRSVDVVIDALEMCHTLPFTERISRMPITLDPTDLLLSKLQIVELNEKDVRDIVYLLAAFPVETGDRAGAIGLDRFAEIVHDDWGWWRTITLNLARVHQLVSSDRDSIVPSAAPLDVLTQIDRLTAGIEAVPKTRRFRLRARVGERKRWYRVPEETAHD